MPPRSKTASRGNARERMLETAERLLGEYGIEGVSLRQIGAATGQGNNSAVQYYFGDKAGLVREIIARRVESFEPKRKAMLDQAATSGKLGDIRTLLEIIFLPLAEAMDGEGRHVYARFMMQFLTRFQYEPGFAHPGWAPESAATQAALLLAKSLPFLSGDALGRRINRVGGLFFNALIDRDNAVVHGRRVESEDKFLADLFAMMEAAARTPLP